MFTFSLFALIHSEIKIVAPTPDRNGFFQPGLFNLKYNYKGTDIPFSYNDLGTEVQLIVDGVTHEPRNLSKGPFGGVILDLQLDLVTPNDGYLKFILTNTNNKSVNVTLGTYTDLGFQAGDGNNRILPYTSKPKTKSEPTRKMLYAIDHYAEQGQILSHPAWQRCVIDHYPVHEGLDFIVPDGFWYGLLSETKNQKFFKKFQNEDEKKMKDKQSVNDDIVAQYSFPYESILPDHSITYGIHIFFIMETELDVIAEKTKIGIPENENTAKIVTWMRLLDANNHPYTLNWKKKGSTSQQQAKFGAKYATDRYEIKYELATNEETVEIWFTDDRNMSKKSNVLEVNVTKSIKPTITVQRGTISSQKFNQSSSIDLHITLNSGNAAHIYFDLYSRGNKIHSEILTYNFGNGTTNSSDICYKYSCANLRSGKYNLSIYAVNSKGLSSDPQIIEFTMDYQTLIDSLQFEAKAAPPKSNITLTGRFRETDLQQKITFHVQFGMNNEISHSEQFTPNGEFQNFLMVCKVPQQLSEGKINCTVWATIDDSEDRICQSTLELIITSIPILIITQEPNKVYASNEELVCKFRIEDESTGTVYWSIGDIRRTTPYQTDSQNDFQLKINLSEIKYKSDKHALNFYVKDKFEIPSEDKTFEFAIINKPIINNITGFNTLCQNDAQFFLDFTDMDKDKILYIHYVDQKNNKQYVGRCDSTGTVNQTCTVNGFKYPKGKNAIRFYLSLYRDPMKEETVNSNSLLSTEIDCVCTKDPIVQFNQQNLIPHIFGTGEKVRFSLYIEDDTQGDIHYAIDGKELKFENTDIPTTYVIKNEHSQTIDCYFEIPSNISYKNEEYQFDIWVVDEFSRPSNNASHSFKIINQPHILDIKSDRTNVRSDSKQLRTISISGHFNDIDNNKNLFFFVQECTPSGGSDAPLLRHEQVSNSSQSQSFNFMHEISEKHKSVRELEIKVKIGNSRDADTISKNAMSAFSTIKVNVSDSPKISSTCPIGTFGLNETINLQFQIQDDTNGRVTFIIDDDNLNADLKYVATNGETGNLNQTIKLNNLTLGEHTLKFYPIDEFGLDASNKKTCPFQFMSKPELSNLSLNQTEADNDETVTVRGILNDSDFGKLLFIMQQFENENPLEIGRITSNGKPNQNFEYNLKNLINQKSGMRTIYFYATDSLTQAQRPSDKTNLTIKMVNDPNFYIDNIEKIHSINEEFQIVFHFQTDFPFYIEFYNDNKKYDNFDYTKPNGGQDRFTRKFEYKDPGVHNISYLITNSKLNTSWLYEHLVTIRDAPQLTNIKALNKTVAPGGYVELLYDFDRKGNENAYFFASIKNKIHRSQLIDITSKSNYIFKFQTALQDDDNEKDCEIKAWMQLTEEEEKNSKSSELKTNIFITKPPTIHKLNFPSETIFASSDQYIIDFDIEDEQGFNITAYVDDNYQTSKYFQNRANNRININLSTINYTRYNSFGFQTTTHYVLITVADPHGSIYSSDKRTFYIVNKPMINEVSCSRLSFTDDDLINCNINYTDFDNGKGLFFFFQIGSTNKRLTTSSSPGTNAIKLVTINARSNRDLFSVGQNNIYFYISSRDDITINSKNSRSEGHSVTLTRTFKPTLLLNPIDPKIYKPGSTMVISGRSSGDGTVHIYLRYSESNIQIGSLTEQTSNPENFNLEYSVSNKFKYGTHKVDIIAKTESNKIFYESDPVTIEFIIVNTPSLSNVVTRSQVVHNNTYFSVSGELTDYDENKPIYFFGKFEGEKSFVFESNLKKSSGSSNPQKFDAFIDNLISKKNSGNVRLIFWASYLNYESEIKFIQSEQESVQFYLNTPPLFNVRFLDNTELFHRGQSIKMDVYIKDDTNVTLKYILNKKVIESHEINMLYGSVRETFTFTVPYDSDYLLWSYYLLELQCVDKYGLPSNDKYYYYYDMMDIPNISDVRFNKTFIRQGEVAQIEVQFVDMDRGKLLNFYAQIDDNYPFMFDSTDSLGGNQTQIIKGGIRIPTTTPIGLRTIKIYCSTPDYYMYESNYFTTTIQVTYNPTLKITQPTKTVYKDGDKIIFHGEINSTNNVVLKYSIGEKELSETSTIQVETVPQFFTASVTIPVDFKFGDYTLNILGVDTNGLTTSFELIKFTLRNPPRIIASNLVNSVIKQGDALIISLTIRDPDIGDDIKIYTSIDDHPYILSKTMQSLGNDLTDTISVSIPYGTGVGEHLVTIKLEDQTKESSSHVTHGFTISSTINNNQDPSTRDTGSQSLKEADSSKKQSTSLGGIYAGIAIVCLVLVALLVVGAILLLKNKGSSSQPQDSVSDHSDLEERETQVLSTATSITPDEVATHDNPLFSTNEIAHDNDPFSDEFEEQPI